MHIYKYILILLISIYPIILPACCFGEYYTITELLNFDPNNTHIFTCKILKTFKREGSYESIAVIQKIYAGSPKDTVYINSGGNTTAGGGKLMPNTEWLIFSTTEDNINYGATVCDQLSHQIKIGHNQECPGWGIELGEMYIEVLETYKSIRRKKFTGHKLIYGKGGLIAEGNFIKGVPDGRWIHYRRDDYFKSKLKKSEITYSHGKLDGEYLIYSEDGDKNNLQIKRIYKLNLPIYEKIRSDQETNYDYINESERKQTYTRKDSLGKILQTYCTIKINYQREYHEALWYYDGYYMNKINRDSSSYSLGEGYYSKGARIGEWKFYNKKGELVRTQNYPKKIEEKQQFIIYQNDGRIKISGSMSNYKRYGLWYYFYEDKLEYQESYDINGERLFQIRNSSLGSMVYTPYKKNKVHGQKIKYNDIGRITSIENYENGILNGKSTFYNEDGTISREINYINSREFSASRGKDRTYYHDGFMSGYYIGLSYGTNKKMYEGELWNGYNIGVWIYYEDNGSFYKIHHSSDTTKLMNDCSGEIIIKKEWYDKDGKLTQTYNH
jgi:antitoxin component YwqK of YwqJK toxin-antitoxin module